MIHHQLYAMHEFRINTNFTVSDTFRLVVLKFEKKYDQGGFAGQIIYRHNECGQGGQQLVHTDTYTIHRDTYHPHSALFIWVTLSPVFILSIIFLLHSM